MSRLSAMFAVWMLLAMSFVSDRRKKVLARSDEGSLSVEGVMIAIGLVVVAGVIITGLTLYVTTKTGALNGP